MPDLTIKRYDSSPAFARILGLDLTGAVVRFNMRDALGVTTVDELATVTTASTGAVEYRWGPVDTTALGTFTANFEVEFSDGRHANFPADGYYEIAVESQTGEGEPMWLPNEIGALSPLLYYRLNETSGSSFLNIGSGGGGFNAALTNPDGSFSLGDVGLLPNDPTDRSLRLRGLSVKDTDDNIGITSNALEYTPPFTLFALCELGALPSTSTQAVHPVLIKEGAVGDTPFASTPSYSFSIGTAPGFEDRSFITIFQELAGTPKRNVTSKRRLRANVPFVHAARYSEAGGSGLVELFRNGVKQGTLTYSGSIHPSGGALRIGAVTAEAFIGRLSNIALFQGVAVLTDANMWRLARAALLGFL